MARQISEIAREVRADWKKINYAAAPYLDAMDTIGNIKENYGYDSAVSIVLYFLGNATSWRGEVAKRVKKELNDMVKGK